MTEHADLPDEPAIVDLPSPNHDARPEPVDMLILHYTGMVSARAALDRLRDPAARVSAHYVVDEDGTVWRLVSEDRRAWHAGVSYWQGARELNGRSIGIEIVNPGHEHGYRPFPPEQMRAVAALARGICARWQIPRARVLGHSDVAPRRKEDPGELFDWRWLAAEGIGIWPGDVAAPVTEVDTLTALAACGYETEPDPRAALVAFQRHFRPERVDGVADIETRLRLTALRRAFGR